MASNDVKSNDSIVKLFAQLDLSEQSQGAINRLPNEMLRSILQRVSAHHLFRFRLVSNKWNAVVESICRDKKCLVIMDFYDKSYLSQLSTRLNSHFKFNNDFVFIKAMKFSYFELYLSAELCTLLSKLFPRIEQLFIIEKFTYSPEEFASMFKQWSPSLTTLSLRAGGWTEDICAQINKMKNLKKLDLQLFCEKIAKQLLPTLSRLEHLSALNCGCIDHVSPFFAARIKSFGCSRTIVTVEECTKLRQLNARFVSSLERLSLLIHDAQVLPFICEHFTSLQMLHIHTFSYKLTTGMIATFARLAHLTELQIDHVNIDLFILDAAKPLHNIRSLTLVNFSFVSPKVDVVHFLRILSAIFPNLEKLIIKNCGYGKDFGNALDASQLNTFFPNLRSFNLDLNLLIDRLME